MRVVNPTIDLAGALEEVYASVVPPGGHRLFRGYAADRLSDFETGLGSEIDAVSAVPDFGAPTEKRFPWMRVYQRDEWLDQLVSRSDHAPLEPAVRDRLFEAIGAAIDDQGALTIVEPTGPRSKAWLPHGCDPTTNRAISKEILMASVR